MPTDREREVRDALRALPPQADVTFVDARTGRAVARREGGGENPDACLVPIGKVGLDDIRRMGIERVSIRPDNSSGSKGEPEAGELAMLTPEARSQVKRERNQRVHAAKAARAARGQTMREATSTTHGAADSAARPGASAEAPGAPTRPDDGPGSVRGI